MVHFAQLTPENASETVIKPEITSGYSQVPENAPGANKNFLGEHAPRGPDPLDVVCLHTWIVTLSPLTLIKESFPR